MQPWQACTAIPIGSTNQHPQPGPCLQEGKWKFIEGKPVNAEVHQAIELMIGQMNAGIKTLQPIVAARR